MPDSIRLGVFRDEVIWFTGPQSVKKFPGELRLVEFRDEETDKVYRFITNNFILAASTIAAIYKRRWQIEVAYIKFISGIEISLTEITIRIRDALMMNYDLMEILRWDRKTILKPPDWNRPRQIELFSDFLC